jgi:hypothetical protein
MNNVMKHSERLPTGGWGGGSPKSEEQDVQIRYGTLKFIEPNSDMLTPNLGTRVLISYLYLKLNSVALVRERTIPTERLPLVGEVSANFCE